MSDSQKQRSIPTCKCWQYTDYLYEFTTELGLLWDHSWNYCPFCGNTAVSESEYLISIGEVP